MGAKRPKSLVFNKLLSIQVRVVSHELYLLKRPDDLDSNITVFKYLFYKASTNNKELSTIIINLKVLSYF